MTKRRRSGRPRAAPPDRWVLHPGTPFAVVHAAFVDDGWSGGPVTLTRPLVAGEPEAARYRQGSATAAYAAEPVVWLRTVHGPRPPVVLPLLTERDVLLLLRGTGAPSAGGQGVGTAAAPALDVQDPREPVLLGILAAGFLRLAAAAGPLRAIASSGEPLLAAAARAALGDGGIRTGAGRS